VGDFTRVVGKKGKALSWTTTLEKGGGGGDGDGHVL